MSKKITWVAVAFVTAIAVIGVAVGANSSSGKTTVAKSTKQSHSAPVTHPAKPKINSHKLAMAAWSTPIVPIMNSISAHMTDASKDSAAMNLPALSTDCLLIGGDMDKLSAHLPSPDAAENAALNKVVDNGALAAQECQNGADNMDVDQINASVTHLTLMSSALNVATARTKAITAS